MALEFTTTAARVEDLGVKFIVYSPAGYGKTVLARTLPGEASQTLLVSAESGLLSLQPSNQLRLFGDVKDMPVAKIKQPSDFGEAYNLVVGPHGKQFINVAIDSLSEIAELLLASLLATCKDPRQAYGQMYDIMVRYIRLFRDLPGRNVYFSAKMDREKDATGALLYAPSMPGHKLTQDVAHFFDEVFALTLLDAKDARGNQYRALRTRPNNQYQAKDRSGALEELEEPNLAKIISKIKSSHV